MFRLIVCLILVVSGALPGTAQTASSPWNEADLKFRAVGITTDGHDFWAAGSNEGIATSSDGKVWNVKHKVDRGGALLLGIGFGAGGFGYAFGTGGTLFTTTDAGQTWLARRLGSEDILEAALADSEHGVVRTTSSLFYLDAGSLKAVPLPKNVPKDFLNSPALAAISPDRMAIEISQGWRARAGFVSTIDGGKTWTFFEPPHVITYDFLREGETFWAIGTETVGYDKDGGGGYGVPVALHSDDTRTWQHATADIKPCHWEGCHVCRPAGCLASASLLVDPYGAEAKLYGIPEGHLTAKWAATSSRICAIDSQIYCADLVGPGDTSKPGGQQPDEARIPPLGTKPREGVLRCIACSLDPVFVDSKASGRVDLQAAFTVGPDGIVDSVELSGAPSDNLKNKIEAEIRQWIFDPPLKEGQPIRVATKTHLTINVLKPR